MSQAEKKKKGLVVIIGFIGVAVIAYLALSFETEHEKHVRLDAEASRAEVVKTVMPEKQAPANTNEKETPSLPANATLPSDIPPAMLAAMEERGMSIDQLRGSGKSSSTMNGAKDSSDIIDGMGGKAIPSAMQKALAERNAANAKSNATANATANTMGTTPEGMRTEAPVTAPFPPFIYQAAQHVANHKMEELTALLTRNMDILALNPNNVQILVDTSNIFLQHNEIRSAQYLLERATVAAPSDAKVAHLYGLTLSKNFESEKAAQQWERSLSIQDNPRVRLDLALLYRYQLNKAELAKQNLEKALALPNVNSTLRKEIQRELDR